MCGQRKPDPATALLFARPRLLVFYAGAVVLVWVALAIMLFGTVVSVVFGLPMWGMAGLALVVPLGIVLILVAPLLRCPHCNRPVTVQGLAPPHPGGSRGVGGFAGWAAVITAVLRNRRFSCIHCGKPVRVR